MMDAPLSDNRYNLAISALTYGLNCLVLDPRNNKLHDCILSIHEEYINILHIIIGEKVSYLLKLHQIYNITDSELATQTKLKDFGIHHYLILYTQSLDTFTFAFRTQHEKQVFKIGIMVFVREAKVYYARLNEFDPFKAEAMMTFLEADKDGGNLLDIAEMENILTEMKIFKDNVEILRDIEEINRILYDQEKIKRPKGMKNTELNELGFQYLLRYYSIKSDLVKIFKEYCNQYKVQNRGSKVSLVDIVRYNDNPIMSAAQLIEFYSKVLFQSITEQEAINIIESFPVYDAEGKERNEKQELINFNNFCSLLSRRRNSGFVEEKKELHHKMTLPLTDYYISCDFSDYSKQDNEQQTKVNSFQLSLKRGVRCLHFHLGEDKQRHPLISYSSEHSQSLEEILKIISSKGFEFNPYPIFIRFEFNNLSKTALDRTAAIINDVFDDQLYTLPPQFQDMELLPSPEELKRKVVIMAIVNPKLFKGKEKELPEESYDFFKVVSFFGSKLDFERKGQFVWNFVNIEDEKLRRLEEVEDQNLSNYSKKIMVKAGPTPYKSTEVNKPSSLYLRLGIQMIGLTFNNINQENYIIQSLFMENGGAKSGYLLKPEWMCLKNPKTLYAKDFDTPLFLLQIKVLSGQNCVINEIKQENVFLEVFLRGNRREEEVNSKVTSPPQQPSYYILFNLETTFTVYCLDLAVLVLLVRGEKSKAILSGRAIRVQHLRQGLHPIYLMGDHFKQSLTNYLFLHAEHKDIPKKTSAYLESRT